MTPTLTLTEFAYSPPTPHVWSLPLPDRDGISVPLTVVGSMKRMVSGILRTDITSTKAEVSLRWSLLTKTQRDWLYMAWLSTQTNWMILKLPSGKEYIVVGGANGWDETQLYDTDDTVYYNITAKFSEV